MKNTFKYLLLTAALGAVPVYAESDCLKFTQEVNAAVLADKSQVLEIVSKRVASDPGCSCEIVKAAIVASEADEKAVAAIVSAAITSAPDQMRLISQCAIATAPDAAAEVQALLASIDPHSGESTYSAKSAKAPAVDSVAPEAFNPLDAPGGTPPGLAIGINDPIGSQNQPGQTTPGSQGGGTVITPVPSTPTPVVTDPNP